MKLYLSPDGVWTGTQADAKAHARAANTTWKECEVPVDKAGLMAFLNHHRVGAAAPVASSAPPPQPEAVQVGGIVKHETPAVVTRLDAPTAPVAPWLAAWQKAMRANGDRNDLILALEETILTAPLATATRLAGIAMSRIEDFVREK